MNKTHKSFTHAVVSKILGLILVDLGYSRFDFGRRKLVEHPSCFDISA